MIEVIHDRAQWDAKTLITDFAYKVRFMEAHPHNQIVLAEGQKTLDEICRRLEINPPVKFDF